MKVLILQNKLLHYRVPVFNLLNEKKGIELTVAHPANLSKEDSINFEQVSLSVVNRRGFTIHKGLYRFCCEFDVVVAMFDIKWLTYMKLGFMRNRPFKLIYWGIGVSTEIGFDVQKKFDKLRFFFARKADALLFYSEHPLDKYIKAGFNKEALFVANNSVQNVSKKVKKSEKSLIVFIGSVEKRKKIIELIDAYLTAYSSLNRQVKLVIIGEGSERENLEYHLSKSELKQQIKFTGAITRLDTLQEYYDQAIVSVSPGQAGLSVLTSFSFGVPFICREDAITGGERLNIQNGYNGYQYQGNMNDLSKLLVKLVNNPHHAKLMRDNSLNYYLENRTLDKMIDGFQQAISYVIEK